MDCKLLQYPKIFIKALLGPSNSKCLHFLTNNFNQQKRAILHYYWKAVCRHFWEMYTIEHLSIIPAEKIEKFSVVSATDGQTHFYSSCGKNYIIIFPSLIYFDINNKL